MERFWLILMGTAAGMVVTAAAGAVVLWYWFACDGWSIC